MIGHLNCVDLMNDDQGYQILEFYAGQRRAARLASQLGQKCAAVDIMYDQQGDNKKLNNSMDMNTSGGFAFPTCNIILIWKHAMLLLEYIFFTDQTQSPVLLQLCELRLACILVLQGRWDDLLSLFGICCSTFVSISRGSTHRSIFLPMGCPISLANYRANKGTARSGMSKPSTSSNLFGVVIC